LSLPHARPMPSVSPQCYELRANDKNKTWRIIYRIDPDAIVICMELKTAMLPRVAEQLRHCIAQASGAQHGYETPPSAGNGWVPPERPLDRCTMDQAVGAARHGVQGSLPCPLRRLPAIDGLPGGFPQGEWCQGNPMLPHGHRLQALLHGLVGHHTLLFLTLVGLL
jgi:hypothetical protein